MPIYEYYCARCNGRFRHLARRYDAPAPPCPRCQNADVERLVSAANVLHNSQHHEQQLRAEADQVEEDDLPGAAQLIKESGRLEDATGVYGSRAYKELIARRAEGAGEEDVADLVDDLVADLRSSEASKMAGAVMFSDQVENRMQAEGPPERHEHEHEEGEHSEGAPSLRSRSKTADNLGWG